MEKKQDGIDKIKKAIRVDVGAIPTTDDYANGWNDCRKKTYTHIKKPVLEILESYFK